MTEYAERDARALEPYYSRHVLAMTRERLNAKADIAAELAWRDLRIDALRKRCKRAEERVARMRETLVGISRADWRRWEELADADEFVRWAKARAIHALSPVGDSKAPQSPEPTND